VAILPNNLAAPLAPTLSISLALTIFKIPLTVPTANDAFLATHAPADTAALPILPILPI
jgi:hypothetical protein